MTSISSSESLAKVTGKTAPAEAVAIPSGQLVILRERELDCDLATAIERVRADETTAQARILVVGNQEPEAAERGGSRDESSLSLPRPQMPDSLEHLVRGGGQTALQACGEQLAPSIRGLMRSLEEIQDSLDEVVHAVPVGLRMPVLGHLNEIRASVDRMETGTAELRTRVQGMSVGMQAVGIDELCRDLPGQIEGFFPGVRLHVPPIEPACQWLGRPADLSEALFLACVISVHRIAGQGAIQVLVEDRDGQVEVRILALGEPSRVRLPREMARLREIFVEQHGGRISPDAMGLSGTGMLLQMASSPS